MKDLNINVPDVSAAAFAEAIIYELENYLNSFSTHAMSDMTIFLQGKKEMLTEIVDYLKRTKP